MTLKVNAKTHILSDEVKALAKHMPTRFDDINKEIAAERAEKYYKAVASKVSDTSTYKLGDKIGNLLDKIV